MPGLVDTHVHASQVPNAGVGLDMPLLDWLAKYTFPTEAMFADPQFANNSYKTAVVRHRSAYPYRNIEVKLEPLFANNLYKTAVVRHPIS